jgi:leucyl aminopeptidase
MRLNVETAPSFSNLTAELVVVALGGPATVAALATLPAAEAERLAAEATRVGFAGSLNETALISSVTTAGRFFAVVGTGVSPKATDFRRVAWRTLKLATDCRVAGVALTGVSGAVAQRYVAEGFALSGYAFDAYKTPKDEKAPRPKTAVVVGDVSTDAVATGLRVAGGINFGRDLANEHPGRCTPSYLAEQAAAIAKKYGYECTIRDEKQLEAEGFNLIMAVGRGSAEKPRLIHLVLRAKGEVKKRLAFVGKGVTYDSGGYSMKPAESQKNMHLDMGGAAAVLGAAEAIGAAPPEGVEIHFIVPTVENMVSSNAFKVMEIFKGHGGITVEIQNTDAEGRLILADAISYARAQNVDAIVDLATLTGACVVALGQEVAGVFSSSDSFASDVLAAAARADEAVWRMPLVDRIDEQLKSDVADLKNIGSRWGGAISAALFLKRFAGDATWAHIDLAGPAMADAQWEYICKNGTGFGVATLVELAEG